MVRSSGERCLICSILHLNEATGARDTLLKMQGVGQKVADCILLFSLSRKEVFPIDVWVERVMARLYFKELNGHVSKKDIQKYSEENFGEYAGIVQQHLFYRRVQFCPNLPYRSMQKRSKQSEEEVCPS